MNWFYIFGASFLPIGMLAVTTTEDGGLTVVGDVVVVVVVFAVVVVIDASAVVESVVVVVVVEGTGFAGTAGANGLSAIGLLLSTVGLFTGANPISISDPVAPVLVLLLVSLEVSLVLAPVDPPVLAPLLVPVDDPVLTVVESVVAGTAGAISSFLLVDSSMELMTSGNLQQLPK